jgi:hypothetical protein
MAVRIYQDCAGAVAMHETLWAEAGLALNPNDGVDRAHIGGFVAETAVQRLMVEHRKWSDRSNSRVNLNP